jgi:hypothetical protein
MTETNFVIINSKFRAVSSKSTSDFLYSLGESLEVSDIAIKSVSMVNAEYNIRAGHNTLIVNNGLVDTILTIPVGQYDINSLMTEVSSQLTSTYGGTNTLTLGATNKKVSFNTTTPLRYGTNLATSPVGFILGLGDEPNPLASTYYPEVEASVFIAPYLPNLQGSNNYHIASSTLGQGQGSLLKNNDKRPIILSVPNTVDFGEVINYEVNEIKLNQRHFNRPTNIQDIDIKILDDDNEIVDLQNTNIEIVLQIIKTPVLPYSIQGNKHAIY